MDDENRRFRRVKRGIHVYVFLFVWGTVCTLMMCACSSNTSFSSPGSARNVILFTIDTLNPQYLGCYGDAETLVPVMDRLSGQGVLFTQCHTAINLTTPSHASIITGVPPVVHGVYGNDSGVSDEMDTLGEVYQRNGYRTGAAVSVFHLNPDLANLGQGFDQFYSCNEIHRDATETTADVLDFLEMNRQEKFFMWVHYMDCHAPYLPAYPYNKVYLESPSNPRFHEDQDPVAVGESSDTSGDSDENREPKITQTLMEIQDPTLLESQPFLNRPPFNEWYQSWLDGIRSEEYARRLYRGTISEVDRSIETIIRYLSRTGISRDTLIVITSDHGESFGEHGIYYDHWGPYEPSIDVPLIFSGANPFDFKISSIISSTLDIAPTVLQLCGITIPDSYTGYSLAGAFRHPGREIRSHLMVEHTHQHALTIRDSQYKYIVPMDTTEFYPANPELYRIDSDLEEMVDLEKSNQPVRDALVGRMSDLEKKMLNKMDQDREKAEVNEMVRDQLRQLGYFE